MKINGRRIAAIIYEKLIGRVGKLKNRKITTCLTVILIGNNAASVAYVNQKQKWAEFIGAKITILKYPFSITISELTQKIKQLNTDPSIHAILIQRPLPPQLKPHKLELLIDPLKDIDGFHPSSPYTFPLALAVIKILSEIYDQLSTSNFQLPIFNSWLQSRKTVILGKGATGGAPIYKYLTQLGALPAHIDSKTPDPASLMRKADIIISAVGKPEIINPKNIKKGVILIGAGIFRGQDGKLHGDYSESAIENIAGFYTPTPGGVGPVNVAMLMDNLIKSAEDQINN